VTFGTHKPTQRHLRQLRKVGIVPYSNEFTKAIGFAIGALTVPNLLRSVLRLNRDYLENVLTLNSKFFATSLEFPGFPLFLSSLVPLSCFFCVVITGQWLAMMAQSGWPVARARRSRPITRQFRQLGDLLFTFVRSFILFAAAFGIALWLLLHEPHLNQLFNGSLEQLISTLERISYHLLLVFVLTSLLGTGVHFGLSLYAFRKNSRMSPAEFKREQREQFGAPEMNRVRKQQLAELGSLPLEQITPFGNLVVDDGSSTAVLLAYEERVDPMPRILRIVHHAERDLLLSLVNRHTQPVVTNEWLSQQLSRLTTNSPLPIDVLFSVAEAYSIKTNSS
jgi:flagellar biosynthesis protein FlhB